MKSDFSLIPFSMRGSWLAMGCIDAARAKSLGKDSGTYLRTMRGAISGGREIFRMQLIKGVKTLETTEDLTPSRLKIHSSAGAVEAVFVSPDRLRLRGHGVGLRLEAETICYATLRVAGENRWEANLMAQRTQLMLTCLQGQCRVAAPWLGDVCKQIQFEIQPSDDGSWELEIEDFDTGWKPPRVAVSIESAEERVRAEFMEWLSGFPKLAPRCEEARQLAAYILWSAIVSPRGHFRREAMLMSKNWMTNVWSWDHCFNAIALVASQPDLAWDQWAVMFDLQNPFGALPDCANDADMVWNFCKPPVHGWALREMRERGFQLSAQKKKQACAWLEKWTDWWMTYRDEDADGLPQYNHGNDSGWDNASCFALGMPIEGPDLAAFLVIQMDVIADLCEETGQAKKAITWRRRADALLGCINDQLWTGAAYLAPRSGDHAVSDGDSLVNFMPIVLGSRLSKDQRAALVRGLSRFVTAHGLATENPKSKYYTPDGYWRGPVWAPSTFLIFEGLKACGENDLARKIAKRFCATCVQSGMAENFDALTGKGLRDRAYTWTSGIFMLMASESMDHPA